MNIHQINRSKLRACTWGLSVSLLVLACSGSETNGESESDEGSSSEGTELSSPPPTESNPDNPGNTSGADPCLSNPLLAGCPGNNEQAEPESPVDLPTATVENILRSNCGQCHGSAILDEGDAEAGMNYIDDFERLLSEGQAIGGNSADSPIVRRMRDGSMPPPNSSGPRPSDRDIDTVANYLDDAERFPSLEPVRCDGQLLDFDTLYDRLQADILTIDVEDRVFARYVLLTNQFNTGVCAEALDRDRFGMNKMLNMLSTNVRARPAVPVDRDQTIYRIDLRNYDWDREIAVNGEVFDDGWEAIAALNPYAVQFQGDEAEQVIDQAGTLIPWMYADSMVDVASVGNLYYALIGVDVDESLDDFIVDELGIDILANLDDNDLVRAGTTQSILSRQDRLAERHEIEVRQGAFWQSFDFEANEASESIFADPFGFASAGREAIFSLPNGLMGYIIADENDAIVDESNILFDTLQNDFVVKTSVSCSGCHAQGYLPMVDEVRRVVESNPLAYEADEFEAVQEVYVSVREFAEIVEDDSRGYQRALTEIDVPTRGSDPVSGVFLRFEQDLELEQVAGDLGVPVELFNQNIALVDPALQIVRNGLTTIDRDDFTNLFLASLCVMQRVSQNQPLEEDCEQALDALNN